MLNLKRLKNAVSILCIFCLLFSVAASGFAESAVLTNETDFKGRGNRSVVSTDLMDFLTNVEIDAPIDENGNYVINPYNAYEMTLSFSENENVQFDDEETLVYSFPEGVQIANVGATAFPITIVDEYGTATISDNTFTVVDGCLRVCFNQEDPNFDRLKAMPNVNFGIAFSSRFEENAERIIFTPNIIKDFVYEKVSDLSIFKRVRYDMDTDTASYVLRISSEGLNENVVIEDRLTGTALIFNQDLAIESNLNGTLSVTPDYTAVENGFRVTIPQMENGEILILRYSAAVDNTKISNNGSVEQTNNTARVTSDQVPAGRKASANFAGQARFQTVTKTASGEPVLREEGIYEQTWKILVNQDHKIEVGGTSVYDWIVQNSRPFMRFDGTGLTVKVTFQDGTTQTRFIPWSELYLWQDGGGIWGWAYETPESDGKASYEITCLTVINTSGALGDLTLTNGAQLYGSYNEASVAVSPVGESDFGIRKEAVGTSSTESEWKVTVTVPGDGLSECHVVDDGPKLTYEGQSYIDVVKEGSFEIEGLLPGESWSSGIGSDGRSFTITFYQSQLQSNANKGLLPTPDGQPREIVIRFQTAVNQEWLSLAEENGYTSSTLYRHRNYACAWAGSYRTETVNASVVPIRPNLVKDFVERTDAVIDGVSYPVYRYSLTVFGPIEDGIVIQDSFDTDYLKFYETEGIQIQGWSNNTPANTNGTATAGETSDGLDITVNSFPKQANGRFYSYYLLSYSLIVKDEDALSALNSMAVLSQTGINLENTARWGELVTGRTVNYSYFPYVDKELVTKPDSENGNVAEFKIIINKYAEDLDPNSDTLAIQDELSSNLRFLPDSLTITPENNAITVTHDDETNTLIFLNVPDETAFTVTYRARVLGNGNVSYSNTVRFGQYERVVQDVATITSSGGGTASNPNITIVKRDALSPSNTLSGATFELYYINEQDQQVPVTDNNGQTVSFTTGEDGRALIVGNLQFLGWTLWADRLYCLVEITPPDGFELNQEPTYFTLTTSPASQIEFDVSGDEMSIRNDPITLDISVQKFWAGPVGADSVTVRLLANGVDTGKSVLLSAEENWSAVFENLRKYDPDGAEIQYEVSEDPVENYAVSYDGAPEQGYVIVNTNTETISIPVEKRWIGPEGDFAVINLFADGNLSDEVELSDENNWRHTFTDLPKYDSGDGHEIEYEVWEREIEGYVSGRSGTAQTGYTFVNTISGKVSVPVTKVWIGQKADAVTVSLVADDVQIDEAVLTAENGWQYIFADLEQYDPNDGHEIGYEVQEAPIEGYLSDREGTAQTGFIFINTITGKVSVPVTKVWIGQKADAVTVYLMANGVRIDEAVLSAENNWQYTFADLEQYSDGVEIVYTVEEKEIEGYRSSVEGNMKEGFTVTNTRIAPPLPPEIPKTGDGNPILFDCFLLIGSACAALYLILNKRKPRSNKSL